MVLRSKKEVKRAEATRKEQYPHSPLEVDNNGLTAQFCAVHLFSRL